MSDPLLSYGYAKTPDLIRNLENASGENLSEFFNDWVYGEGYPSFNISWNQTTTGSINVRINQSQSHSSVSYFEVPVPLRLTGTQGETLDIVLDNTFNGQNFQPAVNFTVQNVQFDPENDIISRNDQVILGVNEFNLENQIVLYPNPTSIEIKLSKSESLNVSQVRIFNALGQLLYAEAFSESINVSDLSSGILFFQIETSEGVINKTIVKE